MKLLRIILPILFAVAAGPAGGGVLTAQTVFVPNSETRLWIEGRSNISQFECEAGRYSGSAVLNPEPGNKNQHLSVTVAIQVEGFECGRSRMNRDLKQALKSDIHPEIRFVFEDAEPIPETDNGKPAFTIRGSLTVAGVTKQIQFTATGTPLENDRIRVAGSKEIKMTDYGVEPPAGLLGLVRAEDRLTVHFDLTAKKKP